MTTLFGLDTSIGWAQWTLKGGWPRVVRDVSLLVVILGVCLLGSLRLGESTSTVFSVWRMVLMFFQAGLIVIFGCARIAAAIRSDFTTRMMESHWLMPVPGAVAINGYIWGSVAHLLLVAAANFVLGAIVSVAAGLTITSWVMPNIVLLFFGAFCWIGSALCAVHSANASGLVTVVLAIVGFSRGALAAALPGMLVLISPLAGRSIFESRFVGWEFDTFMATAIMCQIAMGLVLYWAAVRKYSQPYQTAFAIIPGMLLLAGWVIVSYIGIANWDMVRPRVVGPDDIEDWVILVASLVTAMLLALVPIRNSWTRAPHVPVVKAMSVTLIATAIVLCLPLVYRSSSSTFRGMMGSTGVIVISFLLMFGQVIRSDRYSVIGGFVVLLITWVGPIAIDYTYYLQEPGTLSFVMTEISSFSPIGALMMIWTGSTAGVGGIAAQALLAAVSVVTGLMLTRRMHRPLLLIPYGTESRNGGTR